MKEQDEKLRKMLQAKRMREYRLQKKEAGGNGGSKKERHGVVDDEIQAMMAQNRGKKMSSVPETALGTHAGEDFSVEIAESDRRFREKLRLYQDGQATEDDVIAENVYLALLQTRMMLKDGDVRTTLDTMERAKSKKEPLRLTRQKKAVDMADDLRDTLRDLKDRMLSRREKDFQPVAEAEAAAPVDDVPGDDHE